MVSNKHGYLENCFVKFDLELPLTVKWDMQSDIPFVRVL